MAITQCSECGGKVSTSATACPHCGSPVGPQITCPDCGEELAASLAACPGCGCPVAGGEESPVRYSPVRIDKFVILSLVTFGAYGLAWFYRNWRYIKTNEGTSIWPWARALFSPLWYYQMLERLDVQGKGLLAAAFFILSLGLSRLPDPYWMLAFLGVLPLIPAVKAINDLNERSATRHPSFGWRRRSAAVLVLGLLLSVALVLAGTFAPSTAVVSGDAMRASDTDYLREAGLLLEGEEVLYFYSTGFLSIHSEGAFASNLGVTSYGTDVGTEDLSVGYLAYSEIVDIEITYSSGFWGDTEVRLEGPGGGKLVPVLPVGGRRR